MLKIVIITPIRNEEKFIKSTLECMVNQTVLPHKWIIVNDGSTDKTEKIIKNFIKNFSFIEYIYIPDRGYRKPAKGVIEAFYEGFKKIGDINYDIIAKFDADLKFPSNTLEKIIEAFENDSHLGITGGTRYEKKDNRENWKIVYVPEGFVGGPYKFYRKKCFNDIGGLIKRAGWDGVDSIKANMRGWSTGELRSLNIYHLKSTGTALGEGRKSASEKYGNVSYYMGGYIWYFILRVIVRSLLARKMEVGVYMIKGYLRAKKNNEPRETLEFRRYLKRKQRQNILYWFKVALRIKI